jgi:F-type H+-transporting ATPase subunit delta
MAEKLLDADVATRQHWVRALAAYLAENKMTEDVHLIVNDIAREIASSRGVLNVSVRSASALTDVLRRQLEEYLADQTGARSVVLAESVEPDLIGGLVARTPDGELDISIRTKLKQLATVS